MIIKGFFHDERGTYPYRQKLLVNDIRGDFLFARSLAFRAWLMGAGWLLDRST